MSELVAVRDLEKEYRGGPEVVRVLKGVSLSVARGEVVVLVGASGVGKSTLLHLLGALDRPTAGQVLFDGEDVFARSEGGLARFRRTEVGFIFQFYNLLGEMTALENAMLPALLPRGGPPPRGGARRPPPPPPGGALGRRAAAGGHRPRGDAPAAARAGRRAHRQPGPQDQRGDLRPLPAAPGGARADVRDRHPQPGPGPEGRPGVPARRPGGRGPRARGAEGRGGGGRRAAGGGGPPRPRREK